MQCLDEKRFDPKPVRPRKRSDSMQPNPSNQTRIGRIFFIYSRMDCTSQMEVCSQSRSRWPSCDVSILLVASAETSRASQMYPSFSSFDQRRKTELTLSKKNNWLEKSKLTPSKTKSVTSRTGDSRAETWASPISQNSSCCTLC